MADGDETGDDCRHAGDRVAGDNLDEGERVNRTVAPVVRRDELLLEMDRTSNSEHPPVSAHEPDEEKGAQDELGETRRPRHEHTAAADTSAADRISGLSPAVIVIVIDDVISRPIAPRADLTPQQRQHFEQTEAAADQQVDGYVGLGWTILEMFDSLATRSILMSTVV